MPTAPPTQNPVPPRMPGTWVLAAPVNDVALLEIFAGEGALSRIAASKGMPTLQPDEVAAGGTDFTIQSDVDALKAKLADWKQRGVKWILHMAPPCSTFSRARDRSDQTRLRSMDHPQGLDPTDARVARANTIAVRA